RPTRRSSLDWGTAPPSEGWPYGAMPTAAFRYTGRVEGVRRPVVDSGRYQGACPCADVVTRPVRNLQPLPPPPAGAIGRAPHLSGERCPKEPGSHRGAAGTMGGVPDSATVAQRTRRMGTA